MQGPTLPLPFVPVVAPVAPAPAVAPVAPAPAVAPVVAPVAPAPAVAPVAPAPLSRFETVVGGAVFGGLIVAVAVLDGVAVAHDYLGGGELVQKRAGVITGLAAAAIWGATGKGESKVETAVLAMAGGVAVVALAILLYSTVQ